MSEHELSGLLMDNEDGLRAGERLAITRLDQPSLFGNLLPAPGRTDPRPPEGGGGPRESLPSPRSGAAGADPKSRGVAGSSARVGEKM